MSDMPETEAEWRVKLSPEQYQVLRQGGTERAFTGRYWDNKARGTYRCAGCGAELFTSDTKYESGSGWPSFYQPLDPEMIDEEADRSFGMVRTEVKCSNCGGHLGHVFDDGPNPTGLRYCVNSASLDFQGEEDGFQGEEDGFRGEEDGFRGEEDGFRGEEDGFRGDEDGF